MTVCYRALQEAQEIFGIDFDFDEFERGSDEDEEEEEEDDEVSDWLSSSYTRCSSFESEPWDILCPKPGIMQYTS